MKRITKDDLAVLKRIAYKPKKARGEQKKSFPTGVVYHDILSQGERCFNAMYDIRKRVRRNFKFYRGEQWGDIVEVNGKLMTEEEYIQSQGKPALKQNLIRPPLRNIIGQFRSNPFKSVVNASNKDDQTAAEMMTIALESAYNMNKGKARDARMLESYLLSGTAIYETSFSFDFEKMRAIPKFRAVNIERFFIDTNIEDVLGEDINIVGEIVDIPLIDLVSTYAKTDEQEKELRNIYAGVREQYNDRGKAFDERALSFLSFRIPNTSSLCRVIKVCICEGHWRLLAHDYADASYEAYNMADKTLLDAENAARQAMAAEYGVDIPLIEYEKEFVKTWKYYHLTPNGHCLWEMESPYAHNSHPYVFKLYPMLNGSVWSMVEDLIDQQKMINRRIIMQDFIDSASAKGVLIFPEDMKPDDMSWDDIADEWTRYNGIIRIKPKPGVELPKQIVAQTQNTGNMEFINLQMRLIQDIGGVHDSIQGKTASSGTPASLYAQQSAQSSLNTLDYLETFAEFLQERDYKVIQLIKQFYRDKMYQDLAGKNVSMDARWYDPDLVKNVEFNNTISKGNDTPVYRMVIDDMLYNMLRERMIDLKMFLEHSSFPFSDKLLASLKSQEEQLRESQMAAGGNIPQEAGQMAQLPQQAGSGMMNNTNIKQ